MKRMKLPLPDYIIYLSFKEERMKKYLDIIFKLYKENFSLEFQKIERIIYESHRVDIDQEIRNIAEEHFWEIIQQLFPDAEDLPIVDRDPNSLHEQAEMNKHVFIEGERLKIKIGLKRREVIGNNVYVYVFYSKGNQIYAKAKEKNVEVGEKDESMGIGGIGPWITIEGTVGLPKGFNEESYNEEVLIIISRIKLKEISPDTVQLKDLRKILLNIDSEGKDWDILRFFYTIKKLGG
ncbi:MAG TPA: hypothetical protein ENG58_06040 [Thermotogales bacterium]|nr:hypothetical protein [Thermotogales bacterium]